MLGFDVRDYGLSKVLAAWVAALLLGRAFEQGGISSRTAGVHAGLVVNGVGFRRAGEELLLPARAGPDLTMHDLGGMGFTWYKQVHGGAGGAPSWFDGQRLRVGVVAGAAAAPLVGGLGAKWVSAPR